ncbi:hypothetical protein [Gordonia caeni]|uniref:Integral membrane protein n=1 Tax=Gordonia caeni TaxID=1007097 RepID=A0ABP7NS34_9ACTN
MAHDSSRTGAVPPRILEIRTHGVSGTPPEQVLADEIGAMPPGDVVAVPGSLSPDRGFVHRVDAHRKPVPVGDDPNHHVWAYHWGRMTSGGWKKALWAVLVPFALINTAYAMLPAHDDTWSARLSRWAVHLLGVALTVVFTLQLSLVAYDILAYQCLGPAARPGETACLTPLGLDDHLRHNPTALAWAATGVVVLVLMIGGLVTRISDIDTRGALRPDEQADHPGARAGLARADFYDGDVTAPILRTVHGIAAPTAVTVMILVVGAPSQYWPIPVAVLGLLGAVLLIVDLWPREKLAHLGTPAGEWALRIGGFGAVVAANAVVFAVAGVRLPDQLERPADDVGARALAGADGPVWIALVVCAFSWLALCGTLLLTGSFRRRRDLPKPYRPWLFGATPLLLTGLGVMLGAGFGAGLARLIGLAGRGGSPVVVLPRVYDTIALQWGLVTVLLGAALAGFAVGVATSWWWGRNPIAECLSEVGPGGSRAGELSGVQRWNLRRRVWLATLNRYVQYPIAGFFSAAVVAALVAAIAPDHFGAPLRVLGAFALLAFVLGLGFLIQRAINNPDGAGRTLGVLWDVASFWPREGHPVVPPAYAPVVITDIVRRVRDEVARHPGTRIVLCGHSQGSLIMYAAAQRLTQTAEPVTGLALLSYGSQLQWAYGRTFPDYLDFDSHVQLTGALDGRWINLIRFTDPVGGPVLSWGLSAPDPAGTPVEGTMLTAHGAEPATGEFLGGTRTRVLAIGAERRLPDPPLAQAYPFGRGHSNYMREPIWPSLIADLTGGRERDTVDSTADRPEETAPWPRRSGPN